MRARRKPRPHLAAATLFALATLLLSGCVKAQQADGRAYADSRHVTLEAALQQFNIPAPQCDIAGPKFYVSPNGTELLELYFEAPRDCVNAFEGAMSLVPVMRPGSFFGDFQRKQFGWEPSDSDKSFRVYNHETSVAIDMSVRDIADGKQRVFLEAKRTA